MHLKVYFEFIRLQVDFVAFSINLQDFRNIFEHYICNNLWEGDENEVAKFLGYDLK